MYMYMYIIHVHVELVPNPPILVIYNYTRTLYITSSYYTYYS